jgi:hypothetical protein
MIGILYIIFSIFAGMICTNLVLTNGNVCWILHMFRIHSLVITAPVILLICVVFSNVYDTLSIYIFGAYYQFMDLLVYSAFVLLDYLIMMVLQLPLH